MTCMWGCVPGGTTCAACRQKSSANLLPNPGLDGSATPWAPVASYSTNDADSCVGSGSIRVDFEEDVSTCLNTTTGGATYTLTFRFKGWDATTSHFGYCGVNFFSLSSCNVDGLLSDSGSASTTSNGPWMQAFPSSFMAPSNAVSMSLYCTGSLGRGYYDQLYLGTNASATF